MVRTNKREDISEVHSRRTKDALYGKRRKGEALGKAPFGYKNIEKNGRKIMDVERKEAKVVQRIFEAVASSKSKPSEVYKNYKNIMSKSTFYRILKNPFYIGNVWIPELDGCIQGVHPVFISEWLFSRVSIVLNKWYRR